MESEIVTRPLLNSETSRQSLETNGVTIGERGLSTLEMVKLTICMAGLQFTWTVELSYGTPYLRNLGLSSEIIALVWLAGPLSGLLIQPLVGAISDKSTFKMGRRRPYMIIGGILVCLSMAGIAYSIELAAFLLGKKQLLNGFEDDDEVRKVAILVAVVAFYCLDFSLNAVQASCRALILDIPPLYQQETSNAWAGRMMHIGNIIGYFTGFLDLKNLFAWLGDSQVKILCIISCIVFILSLLVTSLSVKEITYVPAVEDSKPWYHVFIYIYRAFRYLPVPIQRICNVQFFSWMGWFPFLFFSTSWLASIYARTHSTDEEGFFEISTRYGSFALLMFSFVSFAAGTILPHLTPTSYPSKNIFTIYNIYAVSHVLFSLVMLCTFFVKTVEHSVALIASIGIPWAVAMWVPFALVGEFVRKKESCDDTKINGNDIEREIGTSVRYASISSTSLSSSSVEDSDEQEEEFDAGMVLGVHNMYIVFPQFIISIISAVIIKFVEELTHTGGSIDDLGRSDAYGWVFRFGGLMALIAAFLSRYLVNLHVYRGA